MRGSGGDGVDQLGELAGDGPLAAAAVDLYAVVARRNDDRLRAGHERGARDECDRLVVDLGLLADPAHHHRAGLELGQWDRDRSVELAVGARDGVAVRTRRRVTEEL